MDCFSAKIVSEEFHLLDFGTEAGTHTLRLECVGKNVQSEGYYCGIESVRLRERRLRSRRWPTTRTRTGSRTLNFVVNIALG